MAFSKSVNPMRFDEYLRSIMADQHLKVSVNNESDQYYFVTNEAGQKVRIWLTRNISDPISGDVDSLDPQVDVSWIEALGNGYEAYLKRCDPNSQEVAMYITVYTSLDLIPPFERTETSLENNPG